MKKYLMIVLALISGANAMYNPNGIERIEKARKSFFVSFEEQKEFTIKFIIWQEKTSEALKHIPNGKGYFNIALNQSIKDWVFTPPKNVLDAAYSSNTYDLAMKHFVNLSNYNTSNPAAYENTPAGRLVYQQVIAARKILDVIKDNQPPELSKPLYAVKEYVITYLPYESIDSWYGTQKMSLDQQVHAGIPTEKIVNLTPIDKIYRFNAVCKF